MRMKNDSPICRACQCGKCSQLNVCQLHFMGAKDYCENRCFAEEPITDCPYENVSL